MVLDGFAGFVACGGFSYGDTLGAGEGWARSIMFNARLAEQFKAFFARPTRWPWASAMAARCWRRWPRSSRAPTPGRASRETQASSSRRVCRSLRCWSRPASFTGMAGSRLPIAVAHGEGFANFARQGDASRVVKAMRFVDNSGQPTEVYPFNLNGSPGGLTSVTTPDGRFTALMPHPERVFRNVQLSWTSGDVNAASPWLRMFQNARKALADCALGAAQSRVVVGAQLEAPRLFAQLVDSCFMVSALVRLWPTISVVCSLTVLRSNMVSVMAFIWPTCACVLCVMSASVERSWLAEATRA